MRPGVRPAEASGVRGSARLSGLVRLGVIAIMICCAPSGVLLSASASVARAASAPAVAGAPTLAQTHPNGYVEGWGRGTVMCPDYTDRPWVFWQTYIGAVIGDRWTMEASSRSLCRPSVKIARKILSHYPSHLGATVDRSTQELLVRADADGTPPFKLNFSPQHGLTCYDLPSSYAVGFYRVVNEQHLSPAQYDIAWAQAVGITVPFVICLTNAREKGSKLAGSSYFTFGPLATDCALVHKIKADRPDPSDPTLMIPPTVSEANVWGDYSQNPCPAIG